MRKVCDAMPSAADARPSRRPAVAAGDAHALPWLLCAAPAQADASGLEAGGRAAPAHRARIEQRRELEAAFAAFDLERSGLLEYEDVVAAVSALGLPMRRSEIRAAFRALGAPAEEGGVLDFEAFSSLLRGAYAKQGPMDVALESFHLFDSEHHGKICLEDLRAVAADLRGKGQVPDEDLRRVLRRFDRDGDGEIDEEDFVQWMAMTGLS